MLRYSAIALVLLAAGPAQAAEKTLDRTFAVSPGGSLVVDSDGAAVHVSGSDANQVVVHLLLRGADEEIANATLDAVQKDGGVSVTLRKSKRSWFSWGNWHGEENIEVIVPRRYLVNVRTGGGSIDLRNTEGAVSLHTSGGDISARDVIGNLDLRTSGGSIHADNIRGDVDADTSGGEVRLVRIDGKMRANSSGGGVHCSLVGANRGIRATTSGGEIVVTVPRSTTANIDANTSGGDVESNLPLTASVRKESQLVATLNGGGETIYAHTSGGGITVNGE